MTRDERTATLEVLGAICTSLREHVYEAARAVEPSSDADRQAAEQIFADLEKLIDRHEQAARLATTGKPPQLAGPWPSPWADHSEHAA